MMGADIHMYVERREGDRWVALKGRNPYYDLLKEQDEVVYQNWIWQGRDYDLFAVLADVRNEFDFVPVSLPKGLPVDVSDIVRSHANIMCFDEHSHTWLSLRELQEYDLNRIVKRSGWVSLHEFENFLASGKPQVWSNGIGGMNIIHVSSDQMQGLLDGKYDAKKGRKYYSQIEWEDTYQEVVGYAWEMIVPVMEEMGGPDDVRLVFWFDN